MHTVLVIPRALQRRGGTYFEKRALAGVRFSHMKPDCAPNKSESTNRVRTRTAAGTGGDFIDLWDSRNSLSTTGARDDYSLTNEPLLPILQGFPLHDLGPLHRLLFCLSMG